MNTQTRTYEEPLLRALNGGTPEDLEVIAADASGICEWLEGEGEHWFNNLELDAYPADHVAAVLAALGSDGELNAQETADADHIEGAIDAEKYEIGENFARVLLADFADAPLYGVARRYRPLADPAQWFGDVPELEDEGRIAWMMHHPAMLGARAAATTEQRAGIESLARRGMTPMTFLAAAKAVSVLANPVSGPGTIDPYYALRLRIVSDGRAEVSYSDANGVRHVVSHETVQHIARSAECGMVAAERLLAWYAMALEVKPYLINDFHAQPVEGGVILRYIARRAERKGLFERWSEKQPEVAPAAAQAVEHGREYA